MATITVDRSTNVDDAFAMSGGISFVALASASNAYQNQPTGITTWTTATISANSNWQSVCYGNNIVVAVSSTVGTIAATSPAGVTATWTTRTMPASASWYAVAYGLSKFVAVTGGGSTVGAYSTDGAKWTLTGALTTSGDWRALTFGNDRFVTLSYNSTNTNYSTNATTWSAGGALPATRNWTSVVYGEGKFVAVASGSDKGAYSENGGVSWTEMTMPSSSNWNSITYGNGTFVAVSNTSGTIAAYSADGITWYSATLPNTRTWVAVAFGNNLFTAIASSSTTGAAFSYDGISWSGGAITTVSQTITCMCYTPTTWNSNDTLAITNNSTVTVNTNQSKFWNAITLTNGKLAITNNSTSTGIRFTMGRSSGATAAAITPGSGIGDIEITGNWIELGTGDGTSGQTMTAPFSDYIAALWVETGSGTGIYEQWLNATGSYGDSSPLLGEGLAAVGSGKRGKFFIQQANSAPYGPTIINGTDGSIAQKLITVTSTTGLYAGASIQGPGIPASAVVNRVISSTLLETNQISTTELSPDWSSVAYGNSTYVAVSRTTSNIAATSSDGLTWTKRTLPFVANWNSVCYGATSALFVAVCSDITTTGGTQIGSKFCATSPDGITWTRRSMPASQYWYSVATNGTSFVAVGGAADGTATTAAASSVDGVTWVAATMATSLIWKAVAYGGSRYVAVGGATATVCNYDADGAGTWTAGATMTSGDYVALAYSGSRWVAVTATTASQYKDDPTSGAFTVGGTLTGAVSRGIAWDGTNFVVVSTTNSVTTHRSTNGVAWTATTLPASQAGNWMGVCANGSTLVAVSSSSNLRSNSMVSTNSGASWGDNWSSVAYGNVSGTTPTYVRVATAQSNKAAYSTNGGSSWTTVTLPYTADWTSVCWGGTTGLFVAVASNGTTGLGYCASSPDGITWTSRAMPSTINWTSVASDGTTYVAVAKTAAGGATTAAASSTNGTAWVAATMATSQVWNAVAYGGSRYVAVGTGTASNYDADGAGTWTNGATLTSATYTALVYNGTTWLAVSGSSTGNQYKNDPTTGSFTAGGALPNSTSSGVAWDGTNFVVVSSTNSTYTARSTNGVSWTSTYLNGNQTGSWNGICNNGSTLMAVSNTTNFREAIMTSTDSGANWTTPAVASSMPLDVSLTCYNPYVSQLTNTIQFGNNINGNKIPTGAKVRCPNIMFTSAVPVNIQTSSSLVGANMVMTSAGSLTANICLFDESYNTFTQAEIVSLTNCGFSIPPLITECYNLTFNSVGFALAPVRRYYTYSATLGSDGWFTRDGRYAATVSWTYLTGASITDFNYCVGSPKALVATVSTVTAPAVMLNLSYTQDSTWSYVRFYALNCVASFQDAFNFSANCNNNTMEHLELYGVAPMLIQVSNGNTFTDIRIAEDMFNGYRSFPTSGARIGNNPTAGGRLVDNTKYYLKTRTFYDWNNRSNYAEGRTVSATPFIGSQFFPAYFGAYNNASRAVTLTWIRRDPTSSGGAGTTTYQIFRNTSADFTPSSTNRIFDTLTVATVSYVDGFRATITATASPVRTITFNQAGRTITLGGAGAGSFTTAGFVAGGNVVVAGTVSNDGIYTILSFTATVITLTTNHTNLVNETAPNGATLDGQPPVNGTSYYYKLRKYDAVLSGITSASGTSGLTSLTTAGNFNTGLGTITNLKGYSGQFKIRIPVGSTTNFQAGYVFPGLTLAGTGIGSGAKVVSIDTAWQITVDVANSADFVGTTATLGLATGDAPNTNIYVVGPGIARPTRVSSVTNSTTIVVDTAFITTFSAQAIFFEYGTDSSEVEVTPSGPTVAAFNFLTYSNNFTHANWVKTNLTATADAVSGPNDVAFGTAAAPTADRLLSVGPTAKAVQTITSYLEVGATYTFSVYVRSDATHYAQAVSGKLSVDTTVVTNQTFTATGLWQRVSASFTATAVTHTFTVQIDTEGGYLYASNAQVNQGSSALVPITTTTVKTAVASASRTFTFATGIDGVNTITAGGASPGDFTAAPAFVVGDSIIVQSTTDNDGTYVVSAVAAQTLTITPAQPLVNGGGAQTTGSIVGSVLASAAQELSGAYAWCRATGGNTANQGIEVALAALPAGSFWTELYIGSTSNFDPSAVNRVGYTLNLLGASTSFYLLNSNNNIFDTLAQEGYGGFSGTRAYLRGSSNNNFLDWALDYNYGAVPMIGDVASLSNDNVFDDFTVKNFRNYSTTAFTTLNDASGLTLQNITLEQANDTPLALQSLNTVLKGVTGANAAPATNATTYFFGTAPFANDGMAIAYQAVYDNIFYELYHSPTTGALHMLFNASSSDTPPYTIVAGTPTFGNNGRLYFRTAGDSIEYTWPHRIYTVSSFRDVIVKKNGLDLGSSLDELQSLLIEFKIDTGSGYGAYQTATPANLAAASVSTVTGFLLKIKITARPGMLFSTRTNPFVVGETIAGTTSGATAVVDEIFDLTTTGGGTGCIVLSSVTGTFIPTELIKRASDSQTRATNVVTNTQFALFPSFNSYIDGLQIFTNTVGPGDYAGRAVSVIVTVKDANTLAAVESARVLLEADSGGNLPAEESVTITRSGSTASVVHTAHGMTAGMSVVIRGADQDEYNGVYTISNVTTDAYDYTVSGTPATPATGTITSTAVILSGTTNASGILSTADFSYTNSQPVTGKVRRATTGTKYRTGAVVGTITSTGLNAIVLLISDE